MYFYFLIACVPILWIMISLGKFKVPGYKTCPIAFIITFLLAIFVWRMDLLEAITAGFEGVALALWPIIITIIGAVFTYNLSVYTGSIEIIKKMMTSVTNDKRILVLILAWGFGGFLEAISGFGTAVTIPASILAALGFDPIFASIICLIANTTSTAFGAIGIPVTTLAEVTGLEVKYLSYIVTLQLSILIILIPFLLVFMTGKGIKSIKGIFGITLVSGIGFALPQIIVAKYMGAELAGVVGGAISMGLTVFIANKFYKESKDINYEIKIIKNRDTISAKKALLAWLPFILLFMFIIICSPLFPFIYKPLSLIKTSIYIHKGIGSKASTFTWLISPGTLIIIATYIAGIIQGVKFKEITNILIKTMKQMVKSAITIISIVALAKIMGYSGMIKSIADVVVMVTGRFYPLISPLIGALGTFVTGSDTSSNILFGGLQVEAANSIGANSYWLAASNMLGATGGKMISPQSIAVATAATGLVGSEGKILNSTFKICLIYVIISGLIVFFFSSLFI
ncbi:L-lactate permease [Clostridium botulinum]|nr:L-lactate permease [Clostridium botulinum]NFI19032.1 L-lactate permease [Clostridium botulinum]NFI52407.1 L-lactate permease [Clostridium botulinum]NFL93912.1 L-lactate permease [Clostridium botulinum]NFN18074.1 L-lactate permease [Clostridium botulinum]